MHFLTVDNFYVISCLFNSNYSFFKGGISAFSRALAVDEAAHNVRVNT